MELLYIKDVSTLQLDAAACTGCRICTLVCPRGVLAMRGDTVAIVEKDACIECGACVLNCAWQALGVEAGVGCATAVINRRLGRRKACCVADDPGDACTAPG